MTRQPQQGCPPAGGMQVEAVKSGRHLRNRLFFLSQRRLSNIYNLFYRSLPNLVNLKDRKLLASLTYLNLPGLDLLAPHLFQFFLCHLPCSLQQVDQFRCVASQQLNFWRIYSKEYYSDYFLDRYLTMFCRICFDIITIYPIDVSSKTLNTITPPPWWLPWQGGAHTGRAVLVPRTFPSILTFFKIYLWLIAIRWGY